MSPAAAIVAPLELLRNEVEVARMADFLWEHGRLRYLLWPSQRLAYDWIHAWKRDHPNFADPLVLNCHRGYGKTMLCLVLLFERALGRPGQVLRYGTGTIEDTKEIVEPNIQKLLEHCPPRLRPERREGGEEYWFRNPRWPAGSRPSVVHIIGCQERANRHRGKRSNVVALDEGRNLKDFEYVATTVFGPHFAKQDDPLYLMPSTPPDTMDHPWSRVYAVEAEGDGRYLEIPVTRNPDWSPEDDERMLRLFRRKDSFEWRREMLCERISDANLLIVPEFDEQRHVRESYERPSHFIPVVGADGGFVDFFAAVYGYVDWKAQKLVIEDSVVEKKKNTGELADLLRAKERERFEEKEPDGSTRFAGGNHHPRRWADMTPRELADLDQLYRLPFTPAEKQHTLGGTGYDPDSLIGVLRTRFHQDQVVILARNRQLIAQLKNAIRDEKGKIPRSDVHGHYDALMALVYLNRMAPWNLNPYPRGVEIDTARQAPGRYLRLEEETKRPGFSRSALRRQLRPRRLL